MYLEPWWFKLLRDRRQELGLGLGLGLRRMPTVKAIQDNFESNNAKTHQEILNILVY